MQRYLGTGVADERRRFIPFAYGLIEARLQTADLLVLSVRRQALPEADLAALKKYLAAGKPLMALRTSSHAFDAKGKVPAGHAEWVNAFGSTSTPPVRGRGRRRCGLVRWSGSATWNSSGACSASGW